jgi:hypothetical protein
MMMHQYQPNFQTSNVPQQFQQQPQMPFVTSPTAPYTQAQQETTVSVSQQQKPSGSETVDIIPSFCFFSYESYD